MGGSERTPLLAISAGQEEPKLAVPPARLPLPGGEAWATFTVAYKHVAVRAAPAKGGLILEMRKQNAEAVAVLQSYNGWVHLPALDGWMLSSDATLGELLQLKGSV